MFIFIGGVPGVGKTTAIKAAERLSKDKHSDIKIKRIVGVNILCKLAGVRTAKELRALPENIRYKLRPEMYKRLYKIDRANPHIVRIGDGHFCMFDIKGEKYGTRKIQPWDRKQTAGMGIIIANPQQILKRRIKEAYKRFDRQLTLAFIKQEQKMEIEIAAAQAKELGIPFKLFSNNTQKMVHLCDKINSFAIYCANLHKKGT